MLIECVAQCFSTLLNFHACPLPFVGSAWLMCTLELLLEENPVTLDEQIYVRECLSSVCVSSTEFALKRYCLVWEVILIL